MQKKIRNAQKQKIPFMLIAGDEDMEAGACQLPLPRRHPAQRRALAEAIAEIRAAVDDHRQV